LDQKKKKGKGGNPTKHQDKLKKPQEKTWEVSATSHNPIERKILKKFLFRDLVPTMVS
jgi:hypothetical protein